MLIWAVFRCHFLIIVSFSHGGCYLIYFLSLSGVVIIYIIDILSSNFGGVSGLFWWFN